MRAYSKTKASRNIPPTFQKTAILMSLTFKTRIQNSIAIFFGRKIFASAAFKSEGKTPMTMKFSSITHVQFYILI